MRRRDPTRRQFLVGTGCLAIGPVARPGTVDAAEVSAKTDSVECRLALKSHMIRGTLTPLQKLRIAAQAGFDGVELSMRDLDESKQFVDAANETGITLHGLTHGIDDHYAAPLRMCKAIGGDAVLVIAKEDPHKRFHENFASAQRIIHQHLPLAEQLGIQLLIENVRASFLKTAEEMARFIDSFDSPMVAAYFDTGNAITWTDQSAEHWVSVLSHRIKKIDVKDRGHAIFGDPKLKRTGVEGTDGGEVHWQYVRHALSQAGFSGWATAEVAGGDGERLTAMSAWMRSVLGMPAKRDG